MSVYYQQWSHAEVQALHGIDENDEKEVSCEYPPCFCRRCKDSLSDGEEPTLTPYDIDGLTWRDFF